MPRNSNVAVPADTWTEITSGDVSSIRVQNLGINPISLVAGGEIAPDSDAGIIRLKSNEIIAANYTLSELWPGVEGATRVWAWCRYSATVSVSHA